MNEALTRILKKGSHEVIISVLASCKRYMYVNDPNEIPGRLGYNFVSANSEGDGYDFDSYVPDSSGVYYIFDDLNRIIYIGESNTMRSRLRGHFENQNVFPKDCNIEGCYVKFIDTENDIHERKTLEALSYFLLKDVLDPEVYNLADKSKK